MAFTSLSQYNLPYDSQGTHEGFGQYDPRDDAVDAIRYAVRVGERIFQTHPANVRPFSTRCTLCGLSLGHEVHQATSTNNIQENKVATKEDLLRQAEATKASLERLQDKIARLSRFPDDDPCVDGQVINFEKKYPGTAGKYAYVGVRIYGRYYLSGHRQAERSYDWEGLVEFMSTGVDEVWLMARTEDLLNASVRDSSAATPE